MDKIRIHYRYNNDKITNVKSVPITYRKTNYFSGSWKEIRTILKLYRDKETFEMCR